MIVNIKKLHKNAIIPTYSKIGDAGLDLTATSRYFDKDGNVVYGTGLAVKIPEGYVGLVYPRSSISKYDLTLSNSVGVIDSGYVGEIFFKFKSVMYFSGHKPSADENTYEYLAFGDGPNGEVPTAIYDVGDRIGQLIIMPYPKIEFNEIDELESTERGSGGFGSTGN